MKVLKANKNSSKVILLKNKIKNGKGFTLIELMITVAIVGILAAVALPAYQDYVARSQVSEGLTLVSGAKPVIAEYYSNHGSYPSATDIGFNGYVGSYVGSTTIGADGAIVATFSNDAHRQLRGQTVTLTPDEVEETGNLRWNCSSSVASKYLPTSCVNDGSSGNPGGNPGNGGTDPGSPPGPEFSGDAYFGYASFQYVDGVLTGGNFVLNNKQIDADGNIVYDVSPVGTITITPEGNFIYETPTQKILTTDGNTEGIYIGNMVLENFSYTDGSGNNVTVQVPKYRILGGDFVSPPDIYDNGYTSTYPALSFDAIYNDSSASPFAQATMNFTANPNPTTAAAYQQAVNNFKSTLDTIKANNGGSYPADLPKIYSLIYDNL